MPKHPLTLIEYNSLELHPLVIDDTWFLSHKEVALAFNTTIDKLIEGLDVLTEDKHYGYHSVEYQEGKSTSSILFFSKTGMVRLAYFLKTDDALSFLEMIEEINISQSQEESTHRFYNEIEDLLKDRLLKLKENPDASLEEINHFILTLDNLVKKRDGQASAPRSTMPNNISDILETVVGLAQSYTKKK